jgi:hypothetical protein
MRNIRKKNSNVKYYQIPSKFKLPNPNAYRRNFKIPTAETQKFGSIGMYWDFGFPGKGR